MQVRMIRKAPVRVPRCRATAERRRARLSTPSSPYTPISSHATWSRCWRAAPHSWLDAKSCSGQRSEMAVHGRHQAERAARRLAWPVGAGRTRAALASSRLSGLGACSSWITLFTGVATAATIRGPAMQDFGHGGRRPAPRTAVAAAGMLLVLRHMHAALLRMQAFLLSGDQGVPRQHAERPCRPAKDRGTTPGKAVWSYACSSPLWYRMSCRACVPKLSSTLVYGAASRCAVTMPASSHVQPASQHWSGPSCHCSWPAGALCSAACICTILRTVGQAAHRPAAWRLLAALGSSAHRASPCVGAWQTWAAQHAVQASA